MMRMLEDRDIALCLNWYNWYILHSTATFETQPLSLEAFTARVHGIMARFPWILMEEEGKPVGYAYLGFFNTRAAYDWTADVSIYLDPSQRGKGYGKKLLEELIRIAEADGYRKLVSLITSSNLVSEHLHESCGFVKMADFEDFGYKNGKWLGVSYYVRTLPFDEKAVPVRPVNHNPYREAE